MKTRDRSARRSARALEEFPDAGTYLGRREFVVLRFRAKGYTLKEVGRMVAKPFGYSLSAPRIRQIELQAVDRLHRRRIRDTPEAFYRWERFGEMP